MRYFIKVYNNDYFRLYTSIAKDKGTKRLNYKINDDNSKSEASSISRTKRKIRELALCNEFEHFVTWTVNSKNADRFSLQDTQNLMRKTLKAYKRKNPHFKYLFITEKHKNGAFHFHGLVKGLNVNDFSVNINFYPTIDFFNDRIGYCSFSPIQDYEKCCNYITKYITKDCIKNEHNQIYFCSKGLKTASAEELYHFDFKQFQENFGDFKYRDEYSQISDFHFNDLKPHQILFFINLKKTIDF